MANTSLMTGTCLIAPDFNITKPPDLVRTYWKVVAAVNGIAALPTVVLNLLIIWTVLGDEHLRSVSYNLLLAIMAVTDFLVGLVVQPLFCWYLGFLLQETQSYCPFTVYTFMILVCGCQTLCTFMVASVERYLAIEYPHFYLSNITTKRVVITTAIFWIFMPTALLTCRILMNSSGASLRKIATLVIVGANFAVILYCNVKVNITAYRHQKAIETQAQGVQQQNRMREYKRLFINNTLVIFTLLFCCPTIIMILIEAVAGKDVTDSFKYVSHSIYVTFAHLQSLVNPLIISLRLSCIRRKFRNKVFRWNLRAIVPDYL